jgi:tRNA threonylcarbamoyladenosine biosynthesis protein TsaB
MNEDPRLLLIETSGRGGFVGLARGESLCGLSRLEESRRHGRDLAPLTAKLLKEQGWKPRQLDAVIVSLGPGSYTGLRVGLMAAKTLSYATGCALIGVETFAVIA